MFEIQGEMNRSHLDYTERVNHEFIPTSSTFPHSQTSINSELLQDLRFTPNVCVTKRLWQVVSIFLKPFVSDLFRL